MRTSLFIRPKDDTVSLIKVSSGCNEGHDKGSTPDTHEMDPHTRPTELLSKQHCLSSYFGTIEIDGKVMVICPVEIYS